MVARRNPTASPTATEAGVLRPEALAQLVHLDRAPVSPALAPWVENHWSLRWELPAGASYLSSTLPHPACHLSVERGRGRDEVGDDPVVVTGVPTRRFDVTLTGSGWVGAVRFRPGGLTSLTGVPARELRDLTVPATTLLPEARCATLRGLDAETDPETRRARFEQALAGLRTEPEPDYRCVLDVAATMLADRSLIRVADVERVTGLGTRTLQRLFERYVGVSPKWVLSRLRMHEVVTTLDAGYAGSLTDLAHAHGWYDQAHFTREFTDAVGEPPSSYLQATTTRPEP